MGRKEENKDSEKRQVRYARTTHFECWGKNLTCVVIEKLGEGSSCFGSSELEPAVVGGENLMMLLFSESLKMRDGPFVSHGGRKSIGQGNRAPRHEKCRVVDGGSFLLRNNLREQSGLYYLVRREE